MSRVSALALSSVFIASVAAAAAGQDAGARQQPPKPASASSTPAASATLNINTATLADLQKLPGVGAATAERIIEYRQKNGPFKKIEEVMNVQGIGEKVFLTLRPQLTVGAPDGNASNQR